MFSIRKWIALGVFIACFSEFMLSQGGATTPRGKSDGGGVGGAGRGRSTHVIDADTERLMQLLEQKGVRSVLLSRSVPPSPFVKVS
jgi:hypothetical protein